MRIEAAFCDRDPLHKPGMDGFAHPLQVVLAKISQIEGISDQATGRGGDDDLTGGGEALQSRRQIGCAAHRQLRLVTHACRFPDHDRAGGDADADRQDLSG